MPERMRFERFSLDDRSVLVTGATGHLGRPIAIAIAEAGGTPVLAGRTQSTLEVLAAEIRGLSMDCEISQFDVGDPAQCRAAVATISETIGPLSGIVNCAYGAHAATIDTARDEYFTSAWAENVVGPFALVREALPMLREASRRIPGGASVVNVASMYGLVSPDPRIYGASGKNNPPHYGPAKAGMVQMTRYLAAHLGPDGIRVNSVSPGPFPNEALSESDAEFYARLRDKTPLGRIGRPAELVGPVIFLLSDAASYVTGANLPVDGGWTAW